MFSKKLSTYHSEKPPKFGAQMYDLLAQPETPPARAERNDICPTFAALIMTHNSFLSVVLVAQFPNEADALGRTLRAMQPLLTEQFVDHEVIVVNNGGGRAMAEVLQTLDAELRHQVFLLNLSTVVNRNHAIVAGLDRANGDYTVVFELQFENRPQLLLELYQKSREGFDIVYLRAKERKGNLTLPYRIFYAIFRRYSDLEIDTLQHDTRILSRRALNSLLRMRENLRFMKAIYHMVGYNKAAILVEEPLQSAGRNRPGDQWKTFLVAITSYTTFLRNLMLWVFVASVLFALLATTNALWVKFTGYDFFGDQHETVPGWTFLVVLVSIFFAISCLNLYIISIYLANIYQEIKQRPMYLIESIERF